MLGDNQLPDVVQQCAYDQVDQVVAGNVAERAENRGQHRDVYAVPERVIVVQADIGQLHQVFPVFQSVSQDGLGGGRQHGGVEFPGIFQIVERVIYLSDRVGTGGLFNNVGGGRNGNLRVGGHDGKPCQVHGREQVDVFLRHRYAAGEDGFAFFVVNALRSDHAGFQVLDWKVNHRRFLRVRLVLFDVSKVSPDEKIDRT